MLSNNQKSWTFSTGIFAWYTRLLFTRAARRWKETSLDLCGVAENFARVLSCSFLLFHNWFHLTITKWKERDLYVTRDTNYKFAKWLGSAWTRFTLDGVTQFLEESCPLVNRKFNPPCLNIWKSSQTNLWNFCTVHQVSAPEIRTGTAYFRSEDPVQVGSDGCREAVESLTWWFYDRKRVRCPPVEFKLPQLWHWLT